jgi:hypothetical protein
MNKMELVRFDGSEIYESDIRKDNLQNLYWRTSEGKLIAVPNLGDTHLRNIALMLMGFSYTKFNKPDRVKILWLTALRLEWENRVPVTIYNSLTPVRRETKRKIQRLERESDTVRTKEITDRFEVGKD